MPALRTLEDLERILREHNVFERYGITRLGVFGSFARGEAVFNDIDFYLEDEIDVRDRLALHALLIALLGLEIDLVYYKYADPLIMYYGKKDMRYVTQAA